MLRRRKEKVVWSWYLGDPGVNGGIGDGDSVAYGISTKTLGFRDREVVDKGIVGAIVVANHFVFSQMN